jgi:hypothetical protein
MEPWLAWSLFLLCLSVLLTQYDIPRTLMKIADVKAQVDATLTVMSQAVSQLEADVAALAAARTGADDKALDDIMARLKSGTDTLAAAIAAAKAMKQ